jgi:hypothetical protein
MRFPRVLVIIVAFGILPSSDKWYADESETNTEQRLSQENIGSGESVNTNCGENSVDSSSLVICGTLPTGGPPIEKTFVVRDCISFENINAVGCQLIFPATGLPLIAPLFRITRPYVVCREAAPAA